MNAKNLFCKACVLVFLLVALPMSVLAQVQVSGTVLDSQNEPIIGATIIEKGNTKNAAISDIDGNFKLKVAAGKKIVVSYVGMVSQELAAGENLQIVLQDDASTLEEVVAIGYTSKARKDLTGSVGSVSGAKLAAVPVASAAEALQGKIAGVQVTSVDGQPGADINIRVRGATSVTQSNEPLYIVDGFQASNINDIPPSDIASIDVLKDASLTAIYGAKGGNGVIVVTTKSAQAGKVQVTFNGRLSASHIYKQLDLMNTYDFVDYQYDRAAATGTRSSWSRPFRGNFGNPSDIPLYKNRPTNDWQNEVMGNTPVNYSANVTVGGGNETTRFNLSLTQSDDRGIILGSGVRRTNLNFKLNVKLAKHLDLTYNPKLSYRRDQGAGGDNVGSGGIIDVLRYMPTDGLRGWASYNVMEDADEAQRFQLTNPVNDIATNTQKKHSYNVVNQLSLKWNPLPGLMLRTEGNYNITFRDTQRYYGPLTTEGQKAVHQALPVATLTNRTQESYTWTNTASYDMEFKDVHSLTFLLGQEIYHSQYKENEMTNHLFARSVDANTAFNNMGLGTPYASSSKLSTANRTASFFGQVSYNYDHKYLLSGTFRADGSTKFAPGSQWGYFPSVSGAWVVNKENFLKDVKWIDQLKLRLAFGLAGNNNISDDLWRFIYTASNTGGPGFGEASKNGELYYATPGKYPNKDIKWETTITRNAAIDFSILNGRLSITPELYFNTTRDLLYDSTIPTVSGYSKQMQNIGEVTNNGFEVTLNGDILRGKDYVLSANLTLGHNKMTIKKLNATDNVLYNSNNRWKSSDDADYKLEVGGELGLLYGYVYDGLYQWDEFDFPVTDNYLATPKEGTVINNALNSSNSGEATMPGKIKLKDLNGDGVVDQNDKTVIGNTNPQWQGGFGLSGQWKDFDFSANFNYMIGFDVYNATAYALSSSSSNQNNFWNVYSKFNESNRWRYTNMETRECMYKNYYMDNAQEIYQAMNANASLWNPADVVNNQLISYFVEDGSFLRLSDVTIGYTLPKKVCKTIGLNKVRVYVSGSNLFILTSYSGYDPEVDVQSGLTPSMDYNRYPRSRQFSFGLNVTF